MYNNTKVLPPKYNNTHTHTCYRKGQMKFLKKIAGFLGFAKDESHELKDEQVNDDPRVPVRVSVDRAQPGPVLLPAIARDGGVQGFKWYARRLRIDDEGDVADEFLDEVLPEVKTVSMTQDNKHRSLPMFEVKCNTLPAEVRDQVLTQGIIQHSVEHEGRLMWV